MRPIALAGLTLVVLACTNSTAAVDSTFVAVTAELRRIEANAELDGTAKAAARRLVLQRKGLTAEEYEEVARSLADDPDRAVRVWEAIDAAVQVVPDENPRPRGTPRGVPETRSPGDTTRSPVDRSDLRRKVKRATH